MSKAGRLCLLWLSLVFGFSFSLSTSDRLCDNWSISNDWLSNRCRLRCGLGRWNGCWGLDRFRLGLWGRRRHSEILHLIPVKNFGIRPTLMDLINLIYHLMFNFINSLLLLSWVHVFVIINSISQTFCFLLNLVFSLAFSVSFLRLSTNKMINLIQSFLLLFRIGLFFNSSSSFRKSHNVFIDGIGPLLKIDSSAEVKVTLDTPENLLEHCIAEMFLKQLRDLLLRHMSLAEGHRSISDHCPHLLG